MKLASVFIPLVVASGALAAQPKKVDVFPIGYSDTPLGIVVQNNTTILGPTLHKKATSYTGTFLDKAPFRFQDHKNSVPDRLRNIWVRPL